MLILPANWERLGAKALTLDLLQAACDFRQIAFADGLIWAALKLCANTFPTARCLRVRRRRSLWWSIRGVHYRYVPRVDNRVIIEFEEWTVRNIALTLITPPEQDLILAGALQSCNKNRVPSVFPLDAFISFRVLFATLDTGCTEAEILYDLLGRYNRCIRDLDRGDLEIVCMDRERNILPLRRMRKDVCITTTLAKPNVPASWPP